jgi:hypothetical protein
MLDDLKFTAEIPVQFRPKPESREFVEVKVNAKKSQQILKNEEYYLEHCPIEICSILLKFIV